MKYGSFTIDMKTVPGLEEERENRDVPLFDKCSAVGPHIVLLVLVSSFTLTRNDVITETNVSTNRHLPNSIGNTNM